MFPPPLLGASLQHFDARARKRAMEPDMARKPRVTIHLKLDVAAVIGLLLLFVCLLLRS